MKRMVVTGLPCPPESWQSWLGDSECRVLPLHEVFENTSSPDLRVMASYVAKVIDREQPESILCHDLGVPLALIALMKLERKGRPSQARLTLFNGAFRKIDVFKATHPFRVQLMSFRRAVREVESAGGKVDPKLKPYLSRIRKMYRLIIYYSLTEKLQSWLGLEHFIGFTKPALALNIQIIASENDPYIPSESIEQLQRDFSPRRVVRMNYGHFPYSRHQRDILPLIEEFERGHQSALSN